MTEGLLERREATPEELGITPGVLARLATRLGPLAIVDLETTGLSPDEGAEILELGMLLVEPGEERLVALSSLVYPAGAIPRAVQRLTGIEEDHVRDAPLLENVRGEVAAALAGRTIVAHNAGFERTFLAEQVDAGLADAPFLDTLDLLALTHPDAPDLRLESFTRMLLGSEERHRALDDALDTARVMALAGAGSADGLARYVAGRSALETFAPESPWLAPAGEARARRAPGRRRDASSRRSAPARSRRCRSTRTPSRPPSRTRSGADDTSPATACAPSRWRWRAASRATCTRRRCCSPRVAPAWASRWPTWPPRSRS